MVSIRVGEEDGDGDEEGSYVRELERRGRWGLEREGAGEGAGCSLLYSAGNDEVKCGQVISAALQQRKV